MSELEPMEAGYQIYGTEVSGGLNIVCPKCGMQGNVSLTVVIYEPTSTALFFGAKRKTEMIPGGVSWLSNHIGCDYVWHPDPDSNIISSTF